jgi:hypothetical protein
MAIAGENETLTVQPFTKTVRVEIFTEGAEETYSIRVWRQDGFLMTDGSFLPQGAWRSLDVKPADLPTLAEHVQLPLELRDKLSQPLTIVDVLGLLPVFVSLSADALDRRIQAEKASAETIATEEPTSNPIS